MYQIPIIELKIRNMEEQVVTALSLRQEEINKQIKIGVDKALSRAADAIVETAMEEASKTIQKQVESYFRYGEGYTVIKTAVESSLAPLIKALSR